MTVREQLSGADKPVAGNGRKDFTMEFVVMFRDTCLEYSECESFASESAAWDYIESLDTDSLAEEEGYDVWVRSGDRLEPLYGC